jgi:hypothetical protein
MEIIEVNQRLAREISEKNYMSTIDIFEENFQVYHITFSLRKNYIVYNVVPTKTTIYK